MELLNWENIYNVVSNLDSDNNGMLLMLEKEEEEYKLHGDLPDNLSKDIKTFLNKIKAKGDLSEVFLFEVNKDYSLNISFIALCGISSKKSNLADSVMQASGLGVEILSKIKITDIAIPDSELFASVVQGAILSSYSYNFLKEKKEETKIRIAPWKNENNFKESVEIAISQNFARFLADTPANLMTPSHFVSYAQKYLDDKNGISFEIYEKDFLIKNKMNLFLSVTEGSEQPPKLLYIKYKGNNSDKVDLGLVGKGITFDSGGISLKPSSNMGDMKADMTGAAAVLSVMGLASFFKRKINISCVIPLCENLPSGKASKPGDVRISMSGKSVEIDNTDAEGRLVLADAITLIQKEKPEYLIDVATLTGAICIALGPLYAGLFSNDFKFTEMIKNAGMKASEEVWEMPINEKYKKFITSNVADLKNTGESREGGSCTATAFLSEFVEENTKWAHIDIASVMSGSKVNSSLFGKGMTGYSVRLLNALMETLEKK
ncbi:cytosol aminopeptidase [Hamiltosporidium tvaerminnensis]|uniref:leucyl aminopeptidase n=1 Tax=Hamiltosporidium tvaerminnensis TaxID=1176355 RepID=A0A4Q9LZ92_9MICR|nr:cytosol aminopeptidase [Hamiltosporidium tvaerminnensis]